MDNNLHNKSKEGNTFLAKWVITESFIVIGLNIAFLVVMGVLCVNSEKISFETIMQNSLLSTGISIIGIAIAVWAGLEIANSVSQKKVDSLDNKVSTIEANVAPLYNDAQKITETYVNLFLEELLKMSSDIPSGYLYENLSKHNDQIPSEIVLDLVKVEQLFFQVYTLHDAQNVGHNLLLEKSDQGISIVNKLMSQNNVSKNIELYLKFRWAEFNFYNIYQRGNCENYEDILNTYFNLVSEFECECMPEYNRDLVIPDLTDIDNKSRRLKIYFANTIGEYYSKILHNHMTIIKNHPSQKDNFQEYGYKAMFYCKCAVEWKCEEYRKPEVYYRNLGCAYERYDNIFGFGNHSKEIFSCYKTALTKISLDERTARIRNVYYVLLSYYFNYFKFKLNCNDFSVTTNSVFTCSPNDDDIMGVIEFCRLASFAQRHMPKNYLAYIMEGFAYCLIVYMKRASTGLSSQKVNKVFTKDEKYYLDKVHGNLKLLKMLGGNSEKLYSELESAYNGLSLSSIVKP